MVEISRTPAGQSNPAVSNGMLLPTVVGWWVSRLVSQWVAAPQVYEQVLGDRLVATLHDDGVSRREFLRYGSLGVMGLSVAERGGSASWASRRNCIFILMSGGVSQLETFDPKPAAPAGVRGPLRSIPTAIPGVHFSESLPRLAERADVFSVIRTLQHDAAPIHETGLQLVQTGRLAGRGLEHPHFGAVLAHWLGGRRHVPPHVVVPASLQQTGVAAYRGQSAGYLESDCELLSWDELRESAAPLPEAAVRAYGDTSFGRRLLRARLLVEAGVRTVTVNLFDRLQGEPTWDCHGRAPESPATLFDYRDHLCPDFDRALAALLDDLLQSGLLRDTLVVAVGEFGRTPQINAHVGRDHWTRAWSALIAGAGIVGGRVVGATDTLAAEPVERPVSPAELLATIYDRMGLDPRADLLTGNEQTLPLADALAISELV